MSSSTTEPGVRRAGRREGEDLLAIDDLHVYYGNIAAVKGLSLKVKQGEIVTLIGSNGAGKSTTLRTISGLLKPRTGTVNFEGRAIQGTPGHKVVALGICQSPEGRRIFPRMSVTENLELGAFLRNDKPEIASDLDRVYDLFPRLKERHAQKAGTLSGGEQQMLAVGRAMMGRPKLLLLDEPSMGLAPKLIQQIFSIIVDIREQGTTILLVEQNAQQALSRAHRGYVLETGRIVKEGSGQDLLVDPAVKEAYLGVA